MWNNPSRGAPHHLRTAARQRDNNRCVNCGSPSNLEVDHIKNVANGGSHDLDNLQTLCRPCHRKKTQQESKNARAAKLSRRKLPRAPHPGLS
ncbi:HNH endonuclease [Corynebacterium accolens]|uniref:HNH endonuclease n=1 Tax=Corynebacterium accolens TaxID=38284 RepID=UPI003D755380